MVVAFGNGAEHATGAWVAVGGVEHDGVAGIHVLGTVVDNSLVAVGVSEIAGAADGVAGVEVGEVDAVVAAGTELEPGGVDALNGIVGDVDVVVGAVDEVFEVDGLAVDGNGVHVFAVGAIPEGPLGGSAVVVPADAAGGVGHEVGADVADGVEGDIELEAGGGEGVAVAVVFNTDVSGVGMDFEMVVIAAPIVA